MREALKEAEQAREREEVPVGVVVVCHDRIIARAHNLTETLGDPTAHAEMQAITAATDYLGGKYLRDCSLYATLEPCVMCAGAMYWSQLGRLVYGASDPKRGFRSVGIETLHPKTLAGGGLLEEECSAMLTEFFRKKR